MPKEHQKRGRRGADKKRKRDHEEPEPDSKRHKQHDDEAQEDTAAYHGEEYHDGAIEGVPIPEPMPFYGMLDEEEQEYFKKADELLELNQFDSPEDRALFLESVYREAEGKELKIANSQSCSRLMERLILLSTPTQLKTLFRSFSGHFLHLVQHRFASHCCEALFIHAAPVVSNELTQKDSFEVSADPDDVYVSMESLFLHTLAELDGYLGYLMTDRFASHVLRVLLVVLAGMPLEKEQDKSTLKSKKKEKVSVPGVDKQQEWALEKRVVPKSFTDALGKMITDSVAGLDSATLRALAEHPTGNPTLQLLLQLELTQFGKSRAKDETSVIRLLLPDDPIAEGTESAAFINGLVYSTVGSRLLETIVQYAPGKMFKAIYTQTFKERMGSLARNEIASYVAAKILERLSKEDLEDAKRQIVEQIPGLVERNRTAILKTLIERCAARGVSTKDIKKRLEQAYSGSSGFDITRMLKLQEVVPEDGKSEAKHVPHGEKVHGSLLAQAMMSVPGPLADLVFDSLAKLQTSLALVVARDPIASRALQAALTSPNASVIFRRKVIQQFYGHVGELALDPAGSHVIDAIWQGTQGLAFIRERIAEELAENEAALRESFVGRAVWRNWKMDFLSLKTNATCRKIPQAGNSSRLLSERGRSTQQRRQHKQRSMQRPQKRPRAKERSPHPLRGGIDCEDLICEVQRNRVANLKKYGLTHNGAYRGAALFWGIDSSNQTNGAEAPLNRAGEVKELLTALQDLIIPFIKAADEDAQHKHTGRGLSLPGQSKGTTLVEHHPPKELEKILNLNVPKQGGGKEGLLDIVKQTLKYSVNTWDQGFMDKLYASPSAVGLVSELLLATLNTNSHVYQVSPALTLIEKHTAKYLATLYGYTGPNRGGISQPGGSASNSSAIVIARNTLYPSTKTDGHGSHKFTLFTSAHGHYSMEKAAQMFGMGSRNVIAVPVDPITGRMSPSELSRLVKESRSRGETPFFVNATAGTTVMGSYDPFTDLSAICKQNNMWLHIDGSWGGSVIFNKSLASQDFRLKGAELADSIAITPHKMLGVPMTCSFLLCQDMRKVWKAMTLPAGYLFHNEGDSVEDVYDLADLTPQCGRRADSLKLFLSLAYYGEEHYAALIQRGFDNANYLLALLKKSQNFVAISPEPLPCLQVCFYYAPKGKIEEDAGKNTAVTKHIAEKLIGRGFMIDFAPGEKGSFFRVVVNGNTRKGTLDGLVRAIEEEGAELAGGI
ncbi:PLP-dependent transferase [Sporormia fimetaria CBS 119925]|uniref:PLP-dependent transferase n=1 Tax=Sporormia fimetaria CBS 119925 TaxID=1340428 RepID=A0A6A6VD40_9PLEO|nr:PLP-dependent transferase [Sporormia fimetaria CBS 119925]